MVSDCLFINKDLKGWWVDSEAIQYIEKMKIDTKLVRGSQKVHMRNNTYSHIVGVRYYHLNVRGTTILLIDILYIPQIRRNLLFVTILIEKGFEVCIVLKR